MAFLIRQLDTQSIGAKLRSLRKRQGISLQMVSEQTHIHKKYLEAFEKDAYHELPDPLYARHFLKQFVEVLHGDPKYFLARYDEECGSCPADVTQLKIPRQRIGRKSLLQVRSIMGKLGIAALALLLLVYIGMQIHTLLSPPNLIVDDPHDDIQTTTASLPVSGQTDAEVSIKVNSEPILTDPTGRFTTHVTLTRGLNIITIEAQKKYGQPNIVRRTVFLEDLGGMR
ncbi:hypothetical protein HOI83_00895 [Candidatus Uhrbacteria bacterium]|nr:hypothetical protein [Candidatus Uhrbacteria bacterium]